MGCVCEFTQQFYILPQLNSNGISTEMTLSFCYIRGFKVSRPSTSTLSSLGDFVSAFWKLLLILFCRYSFPFCRIQFSVHCEVCVCVWEDLGETGLWIVFFYDSDNNNNNNNANTSIEHLQRLLLIEVCWNWKEKIFESFHSLVDENICPRHEAMNDGVVECYAGRRQLGLVRRKLYGIQMVTALLPLRQMWIAK